MTQAVDLPKIISVDDHVVEPPHVWQTWLPEKYRERGPRIERRKWWPLVHQALRSDGRSVAAIGLFAWPSSGKLASEQVQKLVSATSWL